MNLWGSFPNHENRNIFDGTPPQGFLEARGAGRQGPNLMFKGGPSGYLCSKKFNHHRQSELAPKSRNIREMCRIFKGGKK